MGPANRRRWLAAAAGSILVLAFAALLAIGLTEPLRWSTTLWAGGFRHGSLVQPPFPLLSRLDVFDVDAHSGGNHLFLLGSDAGGRDLLGLVARGAVPSLGIVALVVAVRLVVGLLAGLAIGLGSRTVRTISRGMGRWVVGFPYLALAVIMIQALGGGSRLLAFAVGMAVVGWRDIAEVVAQRIEYVRGQPFTDAARVLGTGSLTFFRLHVLPFVRGPLAVEIPFQASAVLVLLAELGYLQIYLSGAIRLFDVGNNGAPFVANVLVQNPELGELLAGTRSYILSGQLEPAVVPAVAIAVMALAFELVGIALRGRVRFMAP